MNEIEGPKGPKRYSLAEIQKANRPVPASPSVSTPPPVREATARRMQTGSRPAAPTNPLTRAQEAPPLVHTGAASTGSQPWYRRHAGKLATCTLTAVALVAVVAVMKAGADTPNPNGEGNNGEGLNFPAIDNADMNFATPTACSEITYAAYDPSIKGTNAMGPPQHFDTADEGRDRMFQKFTCEPLYLAVVHEFFKRGAELPDKPETDPEVMRLANLYTVSKDEWQKGFAEVIAMIPNKADSFALVDAGKTRYESLGFIPDASGDASVMPTLTLWGERPELGWTLVVNTKYGQRVLRIYCDLQPSVQEFAPTPVTVMPPSVITSLTPPPPPPGTTIVTPPPPLPPPPSGCVEGCTQPPGGCTEGCTPPPGPCDIPGECKGPNVPSDPGMLPAPEDIFEPTPHVPVQPYTPDIRPGAPSDPNPDSPGGVHALPPGQSGSDKPVQQQKPDVNRPVDDPAANAPVNGAPTGGTVGQADSSDPEG